MSKRYAPVQFANDTSSGWPASIPTNMFYGGLGPVFDTEDQVLEYINSLYQANPTQKTWYGYYVLEYVPNTLAGAPPYGTPGP